MSHWDIIEPKRGKFEFANLDWQMNQVAKHGGEVTLTIGLRQPHHPECHQPKWAYKLKGAEWQEALLKFIEQVVTRYREHPVLVSWQLENEALNDEFGQCVDFDEARLKTELELVKKLDPKHPVIMSLANHSTFKVIGPRPDIYATSIYLIQHKNDGYLESKLPPWYHRLRALYIKLKFGKPFFIHELQTEPWGPGGTQTVSREEQDKSMNPGRFRHAVAYALRTGLAPIDLWGLEWWYYRREKFGDENMLAEARRVFANNALAEPFLDKT